MLLTTAETAAASRPLTLAAQRLVDAVNGLPIRLPERERLESALDLLASTEWTRVRVRLSAEQFASLLAPGLTFRKHAFGHVLDVAETLAAVYGFEFVDVAHIAVALSLTMRAPVGSGVPQVVAEAFGLGTLDRLDDVLKEHSVRREAAESPRPDEPVRLGFTLNGQRWQRAFTGCYMAGVLAAVVLLVVHGVRSGSVAAWVLAAATMVSARDSRETTTQSERIGWARLPLHWPVQPVLAVLAVAMGDPFAAVVVIAQFVVLDAIAAAGEAVVAHYDMFDGPGFEDVPAYVCWLAAVPDSYITARRAASFGCVLVAAGLPTLLSTWQQGFTAALYAAAAILVARRLSGAAVVLVATVVVAGGFTWFALAVPVTGLVARALIAWRCRPPGAPVPIPQRRVSGLRPPRGRDARRFRRARKLVRRGLPAAAATLLAEPPAHHPLLTALHAWALVQSGRFGRAAELADTLPGPIAPVRALIVAHARLELSQPDLALRSLDTATGLVGRGTVRRRLRKELELARWRARIALGEQGLSVALGRGVPRTPRRSQLLDAMVVIRLAAQSDPAYPPVAVKLIAGCALRLQRWARDGREARMFTLLESERALDLESLRASAVIIVASIEDGKDTVDIADELDSETGLAEFLLRADRPLEGAQALNQLADHLENTPNQLSALDARIEAAASLYWNRHQLDDLPTRRLWWTEAAATMDAAMRQAVAGADWATLAELIETARLQLAPRQAEDLTDLSRAPFIRVRGVSRLSKAVWYRPGDRPPSYDLERLADTVLGPDTWWWSTWSADTRLYWALVPPDGAVSGGVLDVGPGTDLGMALADLTAAAPAPWPGESVGDERFGDRMARSVLFGPVRDESDLARRLGGLLPASLRAHLGGHGDAVNLAIAPAQLLAAVPWAIVAIGDGDRRLVERCRLAVAPPAGLIAALSGRSHHKGRHPVSLAVLNPGGAFGAARDDLVAASALQYRLPTGVPVVGRSDCVDLAGFGETLRSLPSRSSVVFAGHTSAGDSTPLSRGLLLRPATADGEPVVLSAGALIDSASRYPVPVQGLILACDSADLGQAADGEWLVLGTALLWAGAQRLVVTGFPVVDSDVLDVPLLDHLVAGDDLVDSLRGIQLRRLAHWRATGDEVMAPAIWAAHIAMGTFSARSPVPEADDRGDRYVEESLIGLLDSAAEQAARLGRYEVTPTDVLFALAIYGFAEDAKKARRLLLVPLVYSWSAVALAWAALRRRERAALSTIALRTDTMQIVRDAGAVASDARHKLLTPDHLLAAALAGRGKSATLARKLFGWDGRHPEVVKEIISETQHGLRRFGLASVRYLAPHVVRAVYIANNSEPPTTKQEQSLLPG
ncbi:CHAT domain-containing protein [Amycolatopsis sp. NPDC003731]